MKQLRTLLCFLLAILFVADTTMAQEKKVLTHGWGGVWPPFWVKNNDSSLGGFDIEVLQLVVKGAGFSVSHTDCVVPWKRLLHSVETGFLDLATSVSKSPEREAYAYFIGPYRRETLGLYFRKGEAKNYKLEKIEDLLKYKNIRLGADSGSIYGKRVDSVLKKLGQSVKRLADDDRRNRDKLILGRIDCYLGYPVSEGLIHDKDKVELHPMPLIRTGDIYIILSRKNNDQKVADALNASFNKIKKDGSYEKLLEKYKRLYAVDLW